MNCRAGFDWAGGPSAHLSCVACVEPLVSDLGSAGGVSSRNFYRRSISRVVMEENWCHGPARDIGCVAELGTSHSCCCGAPRFIWRSRGRPKTASAVRHPRPRGRRPPRGLRSARPEVLRLPRPRRMRKSLTASPSLCRWPAPLGIAPPILWLLLAQSKLGKPPTGWGR